MAEKQRSDSMIDNAQNEERTKTETPVTPVQPPVSSVQPAATPVIMVKQQELPPTTAQPIYVLSPDALLATQQRHRSQAQFQLLRLASYFVAFMAFWNSLDLLYLDYREKSSANIAFPVLKASVGLCGAVLLELNKFNAIKVYAWAWFLIYACWTGFFLHQALSHWQTHAPQECIKEHFEAYPTCIDLKWIVIVQKGCLLIAYTAFGFAATLGYAIMATEFAKAENERRQETNADAV